MHYEKNKIGYDQLITAKLGMYDRINSSPVSHSSLSLGRAENYILSFEKLLTVLFTYRYGTGIGLNGVGFTVQHSTIHARALPCTCQAPIGLYYTSTYPSLKQVVTRKRW